VMSATYAFTEGGKKMQEQSAWKFVLDKAPSGWLIKAWSWAGHKPVAKP